MYLIKNYIFRSDLNMLSLHNMIYTLDTYQKRGLEKISESDISILTGKKSSGKSYLIRFLAKKRWSQGKSSIIVTSNLNQAKLLQRHLGEFNLKKYSLIIDNQDQLSNSTISKLRSLYKEDKIEISKKDLKYTKLLFDKTNNKIKNHFGILNNKLLFDKSLSDLIIMSAFEKSSFKNIHFNQVFESQKFNFSEEEYTTIQKNIRLAFELQTNGENKTDTYFLEKSYIDKNPEITWEKISNWIEDSRINILNVIQSISSFLQGQSSKQFSFEWVKISEIIAQINNTILEIDGFRINFKDYDPNQSNFLGLDKNLKEIKEKYQLAQQKIAIEYNLIIEKLNKFKEIKDSYILPNVDEKNIEKIYSSLEEINKDIWKFETIISGSIRKELKSMNFRNIQNESLDTLQKELKSLFKELNQGYSLNKWEDNAFSINKQLIYLENILEDLNRIEGQKINFYNNFEWNKFLYNIDEKSLYLVKKLNIYRPKNWIIFFKNWFIQNLILKNKHYINNDITNQLSTLTSVNKKTIDLSRIKSIKIWQNKRDIFINKYKDTNDIIYQLFNKTNVELEWSDLISNSDNILPSFLPIIIIPADIMANIKEEISNNYDLIIYENVDEYKDEFINTIPSNSKTKLIIALDELDNKNDINRAIITKYQNNQIESFELQGFHQQGMIELLDMNYTERLYAARNLAHLMQSANENIKIFQLKNTVIFSALEEILNKVLVKLLAKQGIKEMRIIDTPFHLLVDNILEVNSKQILLTQNNLLNYKKHENIMWQIHSIEKIKKGGIKIINFNTTDLLDAPIQTIKNFVSDNLI